MIKVVERKYSVYRDTDGVDKVNRRRTLLRTRSRDCRTINGAALVIPEQFSTSIPVFGILCIPWHTPSLFDVLYDVLYDVICAYV